MEPSWQGMPAWGARLALEPVLRRIVIALVVVLALATVEFTLADEWVRLLRVTVDREQVAVPVEGGVSLAGVLDLRVDVLPLARIFGGAAPSAIGRYATSLPVRVRGTVQRPEIALPTASDVGRSLLGGAMRRALE